MRKRRASGGRPAAKDTACFSPAYKIADTKSSYRSCLICGAPKVCDTPKLRRAHLRVCSLVLGAIHGADMAHIDDEKQQLIRIAVAVLEEDSDASRDDPKKPKLAQQQLKLAPQRRLTRTEAEALLEAACDWLYEDARPFALFELPGAKKFWDLLNSYLGGTVIFPSRSIVGGSQLLRAHTKCLQERDAALAKEEYVTLAGDSWSDRSLNGTLMLYALAPGGEHPIGFLDVCEGESSVYLGREFKKAMRMIEDGPAPAPAIAAAASAVLLGRRIL